jgi:hypothetical protein
LFECYARQNRITDRDWRHYDFKHVVFAPKRLTPEKLLKGVQWVETTFSSTEIVRARVEQNIRQFRKILSSPVTSHANPAGFCTLFWTARSFDLCI